MLDRNARRLSGAADALELRVIASVQIEARIRIVIVIVRIIFDNILIHVVGIGVNVNIIITGVRCGRLKVYIFGIGAT